MRILIELRALRLDLNTFAPDQGERVSAIETDPHGLMGNGNPGRTFKLETANPEAQAVEVVVVGAAAGSSGVVGAAARLSLK